MAVLLCPEEIAGTTDLKITHGDLEATAKIGKFPDRMETFFRHFPQHFVSAVHQKGIRRPVRTSDTPAELIKLRQAKIVRVMDDHRVDIGNIQSGLYDCRGYQHINLTIDKVIHDLFQFTLFHLPMCKCHSGFRHKRCDLICRLYDRVDTIIDIVDLSAPCQFPADRFPHHLFVVFHDICLDRHTLHRCFLQNAHIADPNQAHMQRPWDRRCRQGQYIYVFPQLFDLFFVRDTETLLLVDDQKTEIFELHIF